VSRVAWTCSRLTGRSLFLSLSFSLSLSLSLSLSPSLPPSLPPSRLPLSLSLCRYISARRINVTFSLFLFLCRLCQETTQFISSVSVISRCRFLLDNKSPRRYVRRFVRLTLFGFDRLVHRARSPISGSFRDRSSFATCSRHSHATQCNIRWRFRGISNLPRSFIRSLARSLAPSLLTRFFFTHSLARSLTRSLVSSLRFESLFPFCLLARPSRAEPRRAEPRRALSRCFRPRERESTDERQGANGWPMNGGDRAQTFLSNWWYRSQKRSLDTGHSHRLRTDRKRRFRSGPRDRSMSRSISRILPAPDPFTSHPKRISRVSSA